MKEVCSLVQGVVTLETQTVGPKHDPYMRTVINMTSHKNVLQWQLQFCALAGVQFVLCDHKNNVELVFDEDVLDDNLVEIYTGMSMHFWEHDLWEYKERALFARLGPDRYDQMQAFRQVDAALLRYAQ